MATELTVAVPDQYVNLILTTFNQLAGASLELHVQKNGFTGQWSFSYEEKGSETNTEFAQRVISEMVRAMVRLVDFTQDVTRYEEDLASLDSPAQDIPDEIIS